MKENKLIAEFMGIRYEENKNSHESSWAYYEDCELEYHTSWDWLMPVVEKIGDDYYNTPLDETLSKLTELYENIWTLQDLHGAVVEFIKQLNKK